MSIDVMVRFIFVKSLILRYFLKLSVTIVVPRGGSIFAVNERFLRLAYKPVLRFILMVMIAELTVTIAFCGKKQDTKHKSNVPCVALLNCYFRRKTVI